MNFGGDIRGGQARDFSDRGGIEAFEIGENHVPVKRLETLDQTEQAIERMTAIGRVLAAVGIGKMLQLFKSDEFLSTGSALPQNMRRTDVVSDAIDPGAKRAAAIKAVETSPQRDVNFLQQVAPQVRVGLVGTS